MLEEGAVIGDSNEKVGRDQGEEGKPLSNNCEL